MEVLTNFIPQIDSLQFRDELLRYLIIELVNERLKFDSTFLSNQIYQEAFVPSDTPNCIQKIRDKVLKNVIRERSDEKRQVSKAKFKKNEKVLNMVQYSNVNGQKTLKQKRAKRGQYRKYESNQLIRAMDAVLNGSMSVHKAGSRFGVPHSTLEYKVKERNGQPVNNIHETDFVKICRSAKTSQFESFGNYKENLQ